MIGRREALISLVVFLIIAIVVDLTSRSVNGLWPAAAAFVLGWILIWRTGEETVSRFTGPEHHEPWLQATGWFFIFAGSVGLALSLLPLFTT
jgi:hypothetical protein